MVASLLAASCAAATARRRQGSLQPEAYTRPLQLAHVPKTGGTSLEDLAAQAGVQWGLHRSDWPGQTPSNDTYQECAHGCKGTEQPCSPWHLPPAYFEGREDSPYAGSHVFCVARHPFVRRKEARTWHLPGTSRGACCSRASPVHTVEIP